MPQRQINLRISAGKVILLKFLHGTLSIGQRLRLLFLINRDVKQAIVKFRFS